MGTDYTKCDLCGADNPEVIFEGKDRLHKLPGTFPVVMCRECRLIYVNPRPDSQTLSYYYPNEYSPYDQGRGLIGYLKKTLRNIEAKRIARRIPKAGRVLEVGCAAGDLLVPLSARGLYAAGIEMSPHAATVARETHGLSVHTGTLFDANFEKGSFDAVVMRHVVEHFPSPRQALQEAACFLKPGGQLFVTTPNVDSVDCRLFGPYWYAYDPPRHLVVFSKNTLERMLKEAGFDLIQVRNSIVPNNWIGSIRNVIEESGVFKATYRFWSLKNPLALLIALPVVVMCSLVRKSGVVEVVAIKKA